MTQRDSSIDTLLDLNGQVLVIDEAGYWMKFVVHEVPASASKPHGLDYSLTLHGVEGDHLVGFDNAHPVAGQHRGTGHDHKHRLRTVRPYEHPRPMLEPGVREETVRAELVEALARTSTGSVRTAS